MKNSMTVVLAFICMLALTQPVFGQAPGISGKVVDKAGEAVIGAGILVQGTEMGTISGIDGSFSLDIPSEGRMLEVSSIGYRTVILPAAISMMVVLEEDAVLLEGTVVTALGIRRSEKALSYNVQKVDNEQLTAIRDANFVNSLSGKVAGVTINSSSAGSGASVRVVMRGTKSLAKDDNALYVIDGIPMFNSSNANESGGTMSHQPGTNAVADINPEDIESISVLTGASAAALYGSDAANGVVLITTKKGAAGKTRVTVSNSTTFSTAVMLPEFQNTYGNVQGESASWGRKLDTPSTYNPKDFFNTGVTEINGFTLTTGNDRNQTFVSLSSTNATGILPNNAYNRYNITARNTTKFASDRLTLDLGAQLILQDNKNMVGSGEYFNPLTSLYLFPRGESFQEVQLFERYDEARNIMVQYYPTSIFGSEMNMQNPYWIMYRMLNTSSKQRTILNAALSWKVLEGLDVTGRVKYDNSTYDDYRKYYASTNGTFTEGSSKGLYRHAEQGDASLYADIIASFNRSFLDNKLSVNVNAGASLNDIQQNSFYFGGGLLTLPNFFHVGNIGTSMSKRNEYSSHDQTQSIFFSAEAGWDSMFYLTVTGRNDWASQLAFTDKLSYFYPSVGLSTVLSEIFDLPEFISYLKLRGSWAEVASAPSRYLTRMQYTYNEQTNSYVYPSVHYDTNLKPENTRSWELGLNTKLFDGRLGLDLTWYRANTYNQTFYVAASASSGYSSNIVQTGNIQNEGIEFGLNWSDKFGPVSVSTGVTFSTNRNTIIRLADDMDYYSQGTLGISGGPVLRMYEGGSMGDLYINQRLRQSPNGYIWADPSSGNVELETTEYRKIGSVLPDAHAGWRADIGFAGFNLGVALAGRFGGLVVSDTQAVLDKYGVSQASADARDAGGVTINNGMVSARNYYETISSAIGTYYTYDATNVRLSELSLSYTFPRKLLADKVDLTLGLVGRNLLMIYCHAPFDPESTSSTTNNFYQGIDYFQQPSTRNVGFTVKLGF